MAYQLDYYYGTEAEQFSFYRIPKALFKDGRFKGLSSDAKLLYGLMLDRMSLSIKNGWLDEFDRAYIYYTMESIMDDLGCAREKCAKIMSELKTIGLIEKKRQGLGKPDMIYVKNFISKPDDEDNGVSDTICRVTEVRKSNFKSFENQSSGSSKNRQQEVGKSNANNTDKNNTEYIKTNLILSSSVINEVDGYEEIIKENIAYNDLIVSYPYDKELIEEIVQLILEIVLTKNDYVLIAKNQYPTKLVKNRFMTLNYSHISYVVNCLQENTTKVKNIVSAL